MMKFVLGLCYLNLYYQTNAQDACRAWWYYPSLQIHNVEVTHRGQFHSMGKFRPYKQTSALEEMDKTKQHKHCMTTSLDTLNIL